MRMRRSQRNNLYDSRPAFILYHDNNFWMLWKLFGSFSDPPIQKKNCGRYVCWKFGYCRKILKVERNFQIKIILMHYSKFWPDGLLTMSSFQTVAEKYNDGAWPFGRYGCKIFSFISFICMFASRFSVVLLGFNFFLSSSETVMSRLLLNPFFCLHLTDF